MKIAVIGAGVSGLSCANHMVAHGHSVTLFEKAQGPWGRLATRRTACGGSGWDFGAQYFTARSAEFIETVEALAAEGFVAPWRGRVVVLDADLRATPAGGDTRWVGIPGMSTLGVALARGLSLKTRIRVSSVNAAGAGVVLMGDGGTALGHYDGAVLAVPAPQAGTLVEAADPALATALRKVTMIPCWAGLVELDGPVRTSWDAAFTNAASDIIGWMARDSAKPARPVGERWVLHGTGHWSTVRLDAPEAAVAAELREEFARLSGSERGMTVGVHRWRYARPGGAEPGCLRGLGSRVIACGDWAGGGRVEGAWLSGVDAARQMLQ
jgi:renalase